MKIAGITSRSKRFSCFHYLPATRGSGQSYVKLLLFLCLQSEATYYKSLSEGFSLIQNLDVLPGLFIKLPACCQPECFSFLTVLILNLSSVFSHIHTYIHTYMYT